MVPTIYLWIHKKLLEQRTISMRSKRIIEVVRRNVRLPPNHLDYKILDELEGFGLIVKINKKAGYKILNSEEKLYFGPY